MSEAWECHEFRMELFGNIRKGQSSEMTININVNKYVSTCHVMNVHRDTLMGSLYQIVQFSIKTTFLTLNFKREN